MKTTKVISVISAVLVVSGISAQSPASALGTPKVQQVVTWGWEDEADKGHRDFSQDDYDTVAEMPKLQVKVTPTNVGRRIVLESYDQYMQTWSQVLSTRTDANGVAKFQVDPYCTDEFGSAPKWCDHDVSYRIRVLRSGTQKVLVSQPFEVSFVSSEVSTF